MPPPPTTSRAKELRDAAAALITSQWAPSLPDEVVSDFAFEIDAATLIGRKVFLLPSSMADAPIARGETQRDYTIAFLVVERYGKTEGQGTPPDAWVDERVAFTEWLYGILSDADSVNLLADPAASDSGFWPETTEITTLYDADELTERRLYLGVITIMFRENVES